MKVTVSCFLRPYRDVNDIIRLHVNCIKDCSDTALLAEIQIYAIYKSCDFSFQF